MSNEVYSGTGTTSLLASWLTIWNNVDEKETTAAKLSWMTREVATDGGQ